MPKVILGSVEVGCIDEQRTVELGQRRALGSGRLDGPCRQPRAALKIQADNDTRSGDSL
jgi:hypothetical protein